MKIPEIVPDDPAGVDGAELLDRAHAAFRRYCVLPSVEAGHAVTLWVAATHALPALPAAPRLVITSAVKRSGKTRLLDIVESLSYRPLVAANATTAAVFRSLAAEHPPTLLLDEVDTIFGSPRVAEQNEDLRGLLNAGFQRGKPSLRCVGPQQSVTAFPTFAMAALAGIGGVPDTIADRAVNVRLNRRKTGETVAPFRERRDRPPLEGIAADLTAWLGAAEVRAALEAAVPEETGLEDRAADCWEPLIMVADAAGGHWPQHGRNAAKKLTDDQAEDDTETEAVRLLHDVEYVMEHAEDALRADFIPSALLLERLHRIEESGWREDGLTTRGLADKLATFGIRSKRDRAGKVRGYYRALFADPFARYPTPGREDP
ncbi:DUF3631 domain-containing protein [Pseudonocardia sp.]|uniref:DUF3631 domain-containing protein n=1 Tax=Pseudonocardia sp. TaxID=60912 RepID=UPI003D0DC5DC